MGPTPSSLYQKGLISKHGGPVVANSSMQFWVLFEEEKTIGNKRLVRVRIRNLRPLLKLTVRYLNHKAFSEEYKKVYCALSIMGFVLVTFLRKTCPLCIPC